LVNSFSSPYRIPVVPPLPAPRLYLRKTASGSPNVGSGMQTTIAHDTVPESKKMQEPPAETPILSPPSPPTRRHHASSITSTSSPSVSTRSNIAVAADKVAQDIQLAQYLRLVQKTVRATGYPSDPLTSQQQMQSLQQQSTAVGVTAARRKVIQRDEADCML
ncbi:hypothetical protein PMAYCL1PPCAC_25446, partial [Pristionchus mayeri]